MNSNAPISGRSGKPQEIVVRTEPLHSGAIGNIERFTLPNGKEMTIFSGEETQKSSYHAAFFVEMLPKLIQKRQVEGRRFHSTLEVGAGRGTVSIAFAMLREALGLEFVFATDISEQSVFTIAENIFRNDIPKWIVITPIQRDMFSLWTQNDLFSVIISTLPTQPISPETNLDDVTKKLVSGGADGLELLRRFITKGKKHLERDGEMWITFSSFVGIEKVRTIGKENGLFLEIVGTKKIPLEDTIFTRQNEEYITQSTGFAFPTDEFGKYFEVCVARLF